jgi:hypothetical protein
VKSKNQLIREVRNGKVVYIPQKRSRKSRARTRVPLPANRFWVGTVCTLTLGAIAGSLWFSLQYLINPDVAFWMDDWVMGITSPSNSQAERPKSLDDIEATLRQDGRQVGTVFTLKTQFGFHRGINTPKTLLIPVISSPSGDCTTCQGITELRHYRALQLPVLIRLFQAQPLFRLTDKIPVQGTPAADLLALEQASLLSSDSEQSLPLTQVERYDIAPRPGIWFRLTGLKTQGSGTSTFGQVFYYDLQRDRLSLMLKWASPPGDFPQWQEVTGNAQPELVINQTIGAEPKYAVYELKQSNGVASQLKPIRLDHPVSTHPDYQDGLRLARSGLWSAALERLNRVQTSKSDWNTAAQAQRDVVQLHAKMAQFQAEQPAASPAQRVLGYLLNGSWKPALQVFQANQAARLEVKELLATDTGRIQNRIAATLALQPDHPEAIAWEALFKQLQGSTAQAIIWTQKQAKGNSDILNSVKQVLQQMEKAEQPLPTPSPQKTPDPNASQSASPQTKPDTTPSP